MKVKTMWRLIAKSLGSKEGNDDREADKIALIRLLMFLSIFITNCFIIFNAVRTHIIPAESKPVKCIINTSTVSEYETPSRRVNKPFEYE